MSEHEYLQTVRSFYQAVKDGNLPAVSKLFTDDIDWKDGGVDRVPWSTWCHGLKQFEQYGMNIFAALEFQVFQPDEFIVGQHTVVVLGHERCLVRATGRVVEANWAQVFTFRGGSDLPVSRVHRHCGVGSGYSETAVGTR
jgi:ketosteroid isomerase-like protein